MSFTPEQIRRVHQYTIEDVQSRHNIYAEVRKEVENNQDTTLKTICTACQDAIQNWFNASAPYESKHKRKQILSTLTNEELALELIIVTVLYPETTPIQNIADHISKQFTWEDPFTGIIAASELLGVCADTGLYDVLLPSRDGQSMQIRPLIALDGDIKLFIEKTRYMNPMVCEPLDWKGNRSGGYLSTCESVLLGKDTHHKKYQALDVLNIMQKVEWELDENMLRYVEEPNKPLDSQEAVDAHHLMAQTSILVYDELLRQGNSFYFVYKYDFRGRLYTQGYYVNLQSTNYKKSLLNFAKRQLIQ